MNAVGIQVRSMMVVRCTWAMLCGLAVTAAAGCKTGTAGVKPSWWSFGGSSSDPALASAPAFEGDIKKPSDSAKPYPTTTTPNGYVLNETPGSTAAGDVPRSQPEIPAAVTYGSTPKPAAVAADAATAAVVPTLPEAQASRQESVAAAQVGPYAGLTTEPATPPGFGSPAPGTPATSGLSPVPQTAATATPPASPAAPGSAFGSPATAAPRDATAWSPAAAAPAAAAAVSGASPEGRYGSNSGSRFATLPPATGGMPPAAVSAVPTGSGQAPFPGGLSAGPGGLPAGLDPLPASAAPAAAASAGFGAPSSSALPPTAGPAFAPTGVPQPPAPVGAPAPLGSPPASGTPPARRPDPGYRPGGTSSYRPSRAILAEDGPTPDSAVRPASFETPMPRGSAVSGPQSTLSP